MGPPPGRRRLCRRTLRKENHNAHAAGGRREDRRTRWHSLSPHTAWKENNAHIACATPEHILALHYTLASHSCRHSYQEALAALRHRRACLRAALALTPRISLSLRSGVARIARRASSQHTATRRLSLYLCCCTRLRTLAPAAPSALPLGAARTAILCYHHMRENKRRRCACA